MDELPLEEILNSHVYLCGFVGDHFESVSAKIKAWQLDWRSLSQQRKQSRAEFFNLDFTSVVVGMESVLLTNTQLLLYNLIQVNVPA